MAKFTYINDLREAAAIAPLQTFKILHRCRYALNSRCAKSVLFSDAMTVASAGKRRQLCYANCDACFIGFVRIYFPQFESANVQRLER